MKTAKDEVLRYLGHRGGEVSKEIGSIIEESIQTMRKTSVFRHVYAAYDICHGGEGILLKGTGITLSGKDISRHLKSCEKVAVLAATLSIEADNLIRRFEHTDVTSSLILDACANMLIEERCDDILSKIRKEAAAAGMRATTRFSPGYGDLSLEIQPKLLKLLDAERRIGLTCTDSLILLPRKSVTAFIGLGKDICESSGRCRQCSMKQDCTMRGY